MEEELVIKHGYHVFKGIWEAAIVEPLLCERRTRNTKDRCAVAMKNFVCEDYMVLLQPQIPQKFLHRKLNYGYSSRYCIVGNFHWCEILRKYLQTLQKKFL